APSSATTTTSPAPRSRACASPRWTSTATASTTSWRPWAREARRRSRSSTAPRRGSWPGSSSTTRRSRPGRSWSGPGDARSGPERPPGAVVAADLVGGEAGLVLHRRAALDVVAEVDVGQPAPPGLVDQAQHVPRPQPAAALLGVVEEVDGRQP